MCAVLRLMLLFWLLCSGELSTPAAVSAKPEAAAPELTLHYFWAPNCPHCAEAKPLIETLQRRYPQLQVREYEIWLQRENFNLLLTLAERHSGGVVSTPAIVLGDRLWFGFNSAIAAEIEATAVRCLAGGCPDLLASVSQPAAAEAPPVPGPPLPETSLAPEKSAPVVVPLFGSLDPERHSLPALTLVLGLLDSFNPCAFFVLLFLLSMLVHLRSRRMMLLVGGTFVFFSGLIYFLFMAAWLNLFLLAGRMHQVTTVAGLVALLVAALNIKDFFLFHQGPTLSIPESAKPRLFKRMRYLLTEDRLPSVLFGTIVLAVAANSYELLCTAGFPMVYTRALTLHNLERWQYYAWLILYNTVYVMPLLAIVLIFTCTLGAKKLSEWQGRVLKLVSGVMMLLLGLVLLFKPALLDNALAALAILLLALAATGVIVLLYRFSGRQ
jgi:thiol-disulfide isomerase/thioredoxin